MFARKHPSNHKSPINQALKLLCFVPGSGLLWLIILEPIIVMVLGSGLLCWKYKAHTWIASVAKNYDSLISVHFTAVGALAVFAASVVFIFKEKQWSDLKRDSMNKFIVNEITLDDFSPLTQHHENEVLDYRAFIDIVKNNAGLLDGKMRRLYTLFTWCLFMIFLNCMLSVVFAYHARLLGSPKLYVSSYIFAASALILNGFHVLIVFLPTWVQKNLNDALSISELRSSFRSYQDKMNDLRLKSDRPDLGFRLPD